MNTVTKVSVIIVINNMNRNTDLVVYVIKCKCQECDFFLIKGKWQKNF